MLSDDPIKRQLLAAWLVRPLAEVAPLVPIVGPNGAQPSTAWNPQRREIVRLQVAAKAQGN